MKKIFLLLLFGLLPLGGCAYNGVRIPGTPYRIVPPGVQLEVFNHCTSSSGIVYPAGGDSWVIPSARRMNVFAPFTGNNAKVTYTVLSKDEQEVIGTISRSFPRYTGRGPRTIQWIIGGNARGNGSDIIVDHVRGVC